MGATGGITEPLIASSVRERDGATLEVRVNFGVFAGRNATQAEIDDLARELRTVVNAFAIVAEERHEFGDSVEASVRQIVVEVRDLGGDDAEGARRRIVALAEQWAAACIRARADLGELGSELE